MMSLSDGEDLVILAWFI